MKVVICIGSSCHLKGSRMVVETLQNLILTNNLKDDVDLSGTFCMGNCEKGVSVMVDNKLFSVSPTTVEAFFASEIKGKLLK
jgi:NADH:ubiquinone oxidoreductase subunit E